MTSFERFRELNKKRANSNKDLNSIFISIGYPSIEITNSQGDTHQAAVVNLQEKDKAYVFIKKGEELPIGSMWGAKELHLLITEEIVIIKDVQWRKYLALLCNLDLNPYWGYFKGPEASYVNIHTIKEHSTESLQKPLLVLADGILNYQDKIVINGRPWIVQEYDTISTPGITYYSLAPTTISKAEQEKHIGATTYIIPAENPFDEITITPEHQEDNTFTIAENIPVTVQTENGYLKYSNRNIKIIEHTSTKVVFCLPFGVKETSITVKQEGNIVSYNYVAV